MRCWRHGRAGQAALRERVLTAKAANPNLTVELLAQRFRVATRTLARWLAESGLGQTRAEDFRGRRGHGLRPRRDIRGEADNGGDEEPFVQYDVGGW